MLDIHVVEMVDGVMRRRVAGGAQTWRDAEKIVRHQARALFNGPYARAAERIAYEGQARATLYAPDGTPLVFVEIINPMEPKHQMIIRQMQREQ
jgi:hypothetical protein